jgi:hypothetical protein
MCTGRIIRDFSEQFHVSSELATRDVLSCIEHWRTNAYSNSSGLTARPEKRVSISHPSTPSGKRANNPGVKLSKVFALAGISVRIGFADALIEAGVSRVLGHLSVAGQAEADADISVYQQDGNYHVSVNGWLKKENLDLDEAIAAVVYELVEQTYNERGLMAVLHGSAVTFRKTAVVFPASQGSGKSTLVAALQTKGYAYLADDVCPIDQGRLLPVPVSQALKRGSWTVLGKYRADLARQPIRRCLGREVRYLPPLNVGKTAWRQSLPVGLFVYPKYDPDVQFSCRRLDPVNSIQHLVQSGSVFSEHLSQWLPWVESIPAYGLSYQNLQQAVAAVEQLVAGEPITRQRILSCH